MKKRWNSAVAAAVFAGVAAFAAGCSKAEHYGEPIGSEPTTSIRAVLSDPAAYADRTVTVKGRIVTECPAGCWFEMKEGEAVLYVDIGRRGLAIPQRVGREATVEGKVAVDGRNVRLEGEGLVIR